MKLNVLILVFLLFSYSILFAEKDLYEIVPEVTPGTRSRIDTLFDQELSHIIKLTVLDRHAETIPIVDSLIKAHPNHLAPYFFKAAILQGWMSSFRINHFQNEVEENVQKVIDIGNELLENGNDPWVHFYLGGAYGYRGFARFSRYNFIGAYNDARRGINHFKEALKSDSTLYDVYLGLGSYFYWRTAKSKFLRLIAFWIPDKRELGLNQLEFTLKHGRYAVNETIYVLLASYYDAKRYTDALKLVNEVIETRNYANVSDLYFKGRLLINYQKWSEAEAIFTEILAKIKNHPYRSIGFEIECKYWIAKAHSERGNIEEALLLAKEALGQRKDRDPDLETEGSIDSFKDIENLLEDLFEDLNKKSLKGSL